MKQIHRLPLAVALAAFVAVPAHAQALEGTLKKIKDTGSITIGHRESSIPFSYLDDKQQPVGYAMDLCAKIVGAVKTELAMPNLKVAFQPVTSANRIPLLQNGTIDIECGSTTNSVERQKQVAFGPTYFVINVSAAVKKSSGIKSFADLAGKTVASTSGTTRPCARSPRASTPRPAPRSASRGSTTTTRASRAPQSRSTDASVLFPELPCRCP